MKFQDIIQCVCEPCINGFYYLFCCIKNKHKCDICEKRFECKNELASHIRKSHSEIFVWGNSKNIKNILEREKLI
jgi:hypothetical protein